MAQLTIQPSINDLRSESLLDLIERMDGLDLTPILVYRLDSVPEGALLLLAWQFDMLGPQWQLGAQLTESIDALTAIDPLTNIDTLSSSGGILGSSDYDSLRALLKVAIPLHRTRGTPYAIKAALKSLGWQSVSLVEGQSSWGGTQYPPNQGWAVFRALINLAGGQTVDSNAAARAIAAINFFKPVRAWLDSLWFVAAPIIDVVPAPVDFLLSIFSQGDPAPEPNDTIRAPGWPIADTKSIAPLYNAHFAQTGITYGSDQPAVADSGVIVNGAEIAARV
jgi:P2-related tail formation protein